MAAIQTMKRSDTQKRTGGLDFLKHRRFKMGARMCLLYDGFFLLPSCGSYVLYTFASYSISRYRAAISSVIGRS